MADIQTRNDSIAQEVSRLKQCLSSCFGEWDKIIGNSRNVPIDRKFQSWLFESSPFTRRTRTRIWSGMHDLLKLRGQTRQMQAAQYKSLERSLARFLEYHDAVQSARRGLLGAFETVKDSTCDPTGTLPKLEQWCRLACPLGVCTKQLLVGPNFADPPAEDGSFERDSATEQGGSSESQTQEGARNMRACMLLNQYRANKISYKDEFRPSHRFISTIKSIASEVENLDASSKSQAVKDMFVNTRHGEMVRAAQDHQDMLSATLGEDGVAEMEAAGRKVGGLSVPLLVCTCGSSREAGLDWCEAEEMGAERRMKGEAAGLANLRKQSGIAPQDGSATSSAAPMPSAPVGAGSFGEMSLMDFVVKEKTRGRRENRGSIERGWAAKQVRMAPDDQAMHTIP